MIFIFDWIFKFCLRFLQDASHSELEWKLDQEPRRRASEQENFCLRFLVYIYHRAILKPRTLVWPPLMYNCLCTTVNTKDYGPGQNHPREENVCRARERRRGSFSTRQEIQIGTSEPGVQVLLPPEE